MTPTEVLKNEHRVIEQVLDCLEKIADLCETDGRLDAVSAREAIEFFREFADRCHHGKEEVHLFEMMEARGFPSEDGPVAVMRAEHEDGRRMIGGMDQHIDGASGGDHESCRAYARYARDYVLMLRDHIQKEDHCLFPMADQAFDDAAQAELRDRFERTEREDGGAEIHEQYARLADALADRYEVVKGRIPAGALSHGRGTGA